MKQQEEWRQVYLQPKYEVSNLGRVRNKKTGKIITQYVNNCKYHQVHLSWRMDKDGNYVLKNGKKVQYVPVVSRLVAEAFLPIPQKYLDRGLTMEDLECNHKNQIKSDNYVSNLEWLTRTENANYGDRNQRQRKYAINMTTEHRSKLSEAAKKRPFHSTEKQPIISISALGEEVEYGCINDCARSLGYNPSRVHYAIKHSKKIDGYSFKKKL